MKFFVRLFLLAFTFATISILTLYKNYKQASAQINGSKPNIILILTDDQDEASLAYMPKLNSLLKDQGTTFSNFFFNYALCCPSRATILRGQYMHNHKIEDNNGWTPFNQMGYENSTIATWLNDVEYRNIYIGKYLNGYVSDAPDTYVPPSWDEWYAVVDEGKGNGNNYYLNENGSVVFYGNAETDYMTDVFSKKATDAIAKSTTDLSPFFLHIASHAPHTPFVPAKRHAGLFTGTGVPRTPNFNEEDYSDKVKQLPLLDQATIDKYDKQYGKRLEMLQSVDEMIENIINALTVAGQLDNTYIFFVSDNGYHMAHHRLKLGKGTTYEEDIRFPLIVRGPSVPAGQVVDYLVGNVDLAPTFAEIGGATIPSFVDGRSLSPLLTSSLPPNENWRQSFVLDGPRGKLPGLRTKEYKYVEYGRSLGELYPLLSDPYELENQFTSASADLKLKLKTRLGQMKTCVADSCRSIEQQPL